MLIAQISDLHVQLQPGLDGVMASDHLQRCVSVLNALDPRPDLVVITGDLTNSGGAGEYSLLKDVIGGLAIPFLLIPGNHDHVGHLREAFPDDARLHADARFVQYVDDAFPVRIVALDTTVPGKHHGALCADRLQWLSTWLDSAPDRPTVVIMHHPPFDTGMAQMDAIGLLEGRDAFAEIIAGHGNVKRVLCGHIHRTVVAQVGGVVASTCPGTAHQVELDLTRPGRLAAYFEPPGYQLHLVDDTGCVTHHAVIGNYTGPFYE